MSRRRVSLLLVATGIVLGVVLARGWFPSPAAPGYRVIGQWGETGSRPGRFDGPIGIVVADMYNDRVQKLSAAGTFLVAIRAGFDRPTDITEAPDGTLYVVDFGHDRIVRLAPGS